MTQRPTFTRRTSRPGYIVSFDGRRTVGFVIKGQSSLRGHGTENWTAKRGDGTFVGVFASRADAAEALRPR